MRLDKDEELISREMAKIKDSVEYLIFIHSIDAQNKGFAAGEREVLPLLLSGDLRLRDDRKIEPIVAREVENG